MKTGNRLRENIFSYREIKDGKVIVFWYGKQVKTLKGKRAEKFLSAITTLDDEGAQLLMARVTGNFKRGNERDNKNT